MPTLSALKKSDLTRHVGTEIHGLDLLSLSDAGVGELLELLARRGVVARDMTELCNAVHLLHVPQSIDKEAAESVARAARDHTGA